MYIILEASEMSNKFVKLGSDETWSGLKGLAEIHLFKTLIISLELATYFGRKKPASMGAFEQTPHEASVGCSQLPHTMGWADRVTQPCLLSRTSLNQSCENCLLPWTAKDLFYFMFFYHMSNTWMYSSFKR